MLVEVDNKDSKLKYSVYAWMQEEDGSLISHATKQGVYQHHHNFWFELEFSNPSENYSSLKPSQMDAFIKYIEEKHPFLKLCDSYWKAQELVKNNYKSWRKTWEKEEKEKAKCKEKEKVGKKEMKRKKKEKRKERDKHPREIQVINIESSSDEEGSEREARPASKPSKEVKQQSAKPKDVVNGNLSSRKIGEAITFATIDVKELADKAAFKLNASNSAANAPQHDTPVPTGSSEPAASSTSTTVDSIESFATKVKGLPKTILTAKKDHPFSAYAGDIDTSKISDKDLWPTYNGPLTKIIPTGDHDTRKHLVMDPTILTPKLKRLEGTIDLVVAVAGKVPEKPPSKPKKQKANDASGGGGRSAKKTKPVPSPMEIPNLISLK
ncbi:hypothetical protein PQX77_015540 [Marasmius sp. AFHP31]|nr:hypothetical protein PQX77_015540 [Marasmius sp. AFHP31]